MKPHSADVAVVGAGISGLATAFWLMKKGLEVVVLEKDSAPGGTMKSTRDQGFLIEHGPNSALETTPLIARLVDDLGLTEDFVYAHPHAKNRFIVRQGSLMPLPTNPLSFLATPLFSFRAKLRLLKEPFIGKGGNEESVGEFVTRRLGTEFLDYAIDPFVAGVYAARPETLSVRAAFPKLYALEETYGGLIRGMILGRKDRAKRQEQSKDRAKSFSFRSGMQSLPHALARVLEGRILFGAKVTSMRDIALSSEGESNDRRYRIEYLRNDRTEEVQAENVLLSLPAGGAADLIHRFSPTLSQELAGITYPPVASLFLGYRRDAVNHPLDGFGFLVPSREHRTILGCLWSSSLFPDRAPSDCVGLTVFVGGGRQPSLALLADEQLIELASNELKNIMQIRGKHVYCSITRWKKAIPQYELGHLTKMEMVSEFERTHPGLFFCSNYRGGISVGDCVQNAWSMSERIAESSKKSLLR